MVQKPFKNRRKINSRMLHIFAKQRKKGRKIRLKLIRQCYIVLQSNTRNEEKSIKIHSKIDEKSIRECYIALQNIVRNDAKSHQKLIRQCYIILQSNVRNDAKNTKNRSKFVQKSTKIDPPLLHNFAKQNEKGYKNR